MHKEDINTEYKKEYSENLKKSIIAFANTFGGTISIGIDDAGQVVGVDNVDATMLQITNAIRDGIKPDVSMFTKCEHKVLEGKNIVVITVQKGTATPYYLAHKGIRPEGVFIRQGASSVPASETAILNMIRLSAGDSYEGNRSLKQELTFTTLEQEFADAGLALGDSQFKSLQLIGSDGLHTNLALLLSEQCVHSVKLAVFEGNNKEVFKDRQEFTGSLLLQLRDCFTAIDHFNKRGAAFDGLKRIDKRDYPVTAIREALLNCLVHREYALSGSTLISIFDDRMELVTLGGLVQGIAKDDMLLGVSLLRNPHLANIFYRLKLIEAYGTGIPKIMESYQASSSNPAPKLEITDNAFKITLYNRNIGHNRFDTDTTSTTKLTAKEKAIMQLFDSKEAITRKDIEIALGVRQSMAIRHLNHLLSKGYIAKVGKGVKLAYRATVHTRSKIKRI